MLSPAVVVVVAVAAVPAEPAEEAEAQKVDVAEVEVQQLCSQIVLSTVAAQPSPSLEYHHHLQTWLQLLCHSVCTPIES